MENIFTTIRDSMVSLKTSTISSIARVSTRRVLDVMRALKRRGIVGCVPSHGELEWFIEPPAPAAYKQKSAPWVWPSV